MQKKPKNILCRTIVKSFPTLAGKDGDLFQQATKVLSYFDFVGSTEDFDKKVPRLLTEIGCKVPDMKRQKNVTTDDEYAALMSKVRFSEEDSELDIRLYKHYSKLSEMDNPFCVKYDDTEDKLQYLANRKQNIKLNHQEMLEQLARELKQYQVKNAVIRNARRAALLRAKLLGSIIQQAREETIS